MNTKIRRSKGMLWLLFCLMAAMFPAAVQVQASSDDAWVRDDYGLFSDEEEQSLNGKCQEFYEKNGIPAFILTADNSLTGGSSDSDTIAYIEDYADRYIDGDCVGMILNMETRFLYLDIKCDAEETRSRLPDQSQRRIHDAVKEQLSRGNWYGSAMTFLNQADAEYNREGTSNSPANLAVKGGISALLAALCTAIMYSFRAMAHKEKRIASTADNYVVGGVINLTRKTDQFVRTYVTRVAKPKNNDSGGGTSTHTSSGGHSHSGGGSHF